MPLSAETVDEVDE